MEAFAVALFGVVATGAVSKLVKVVEDLDTKGKASKAMKIDAFYIEGDLEFIRILMKESFDQSGGHVGRSHLVCIGLLRCLAYDIEDCMDSFNPEKKNLSDFATEIANLRARSIATKDQISSNMKLIALAFNGSAQGAVVGTAQGAPAVPRELQDLLSDKNHTEWLDLNLDCLLYFCLFPPIHDVSTKPLMRRWLAEGLVQGEDAAVQNLEILITASIISSTHTSNNGVTCRPTRDMHAGISQMSMSRNFVLLCDGTAQLPADRPRRLSVHPPANGQLNLPQDLSRLRTLAVFPAAGAANPADYEAVLDFTRYKVLRVLDLKECVDLSEQQLRDIWGQQVLMKYLSINLGSIDRIERAIGRLDQLETLDLSAAGGQICQTVTVYKEVLLLPKLKHLLGKFQLSATDTPSVPVLGWFESSLEKFLRDKSKLETLAGFVTGETLGFPQLMNLMIRLREVKIWCESNASKRNLKDLSKAITEFVRKTITEPQVHRSLSIHFEGSSEVFTNKIVSVDGKLDSLELHGKLDTLQQRGKSSPLPQFVAALSTIVELCLWSTGLSWTDIRDGLSTVKGLKYLKLIEDNLGHVIIEPADHLKSIQRICLVCVPALDITIQAAALPHLVSLHMLCQHLHVTPGTPGGIEIAHMKKLKEVTLHQQVAGGIRAEWQNAVDGHTNRPLPVLLPLQGP
ncbi:disease resistance protein RGA4-like [Triticum dicoccoides]|uniref:disease resistance protein RGA4-like n=1 Tax=Triticum dicoccoides TaxID=85692 RepID=UPI000E7C5E63|nr:disease resistance protein RGA4-like [Triticum dicoccoides]